MNCVLKELIFTAIDYIGLLSISDIHRQYLFSISYVWPPH